LKEVKLPVGWLSDGFSKYETVLEGSCAQAPKGPFEPIRVSKQAILESAGEQAASFRDRVKTSRAAQVHYQESRAYVSDPTYRHLHRGEALAGFRQS
jgi:hypothetical protein